MTRDSRKHQKQKERRNAKRKIKRRDLVRRESAGIAERLRRFSAAPILHCCVHVELWEAGIGNVLLSRELVNGDVAFASFLVDIYCLGVKDAFADVLSRKEYDERIYERTTAVSHDWKPACARKLVESAVAYAQDLGLSPHPDYRKSAPIFGSIDASECADEFQFGQNGKPYFFAGPHDSPERCAQVVNILRNRLGDDGFHFTYPASALPGFEHLPAANNVFIEGPNDEE